MAKTLEVASEEGAFALSDRATFISRRDDLDLAIVYQDDDELANVYSAVEPEVDAAGVDAEAARAFVEFLRSAQGRALIGAYGVDRFGESLFTPEG